MEITSFLTSWCPCFCEADTLTSLDKKIVKLAIDTLVTLALSCLAAPLLSGTLAEALTFGTCITIASLTVPPLVDRVLPRGDYRISAPLHALVSSVVARFVGVPMSFERSLAFLAVGEAFIALYRRR